MFDFGVVPVVMKGWSTAPQRLLLAAMCAGALVAATARGARPLAQLVWTGLVGRASAAELAGIEDSEVGRTPYGVAARALFEAAMGGDPRPYLSRAVALDPADPAWRMIRVIYSSGKPTLVSQATDPAGIRTLEEDLVVLGGLDGGNAAVVFYRAVLAFQEGNTDEGASLMHAAAQRRSWRTGLDRLHGLAPAAAARAFGHDLRRILSAVDFVPMVSIRPAVAAVGAYLTLDVDSEPLDEAVRLRRTLDIGRLALLIRSTPGRTNAEQVLGDQMLGHVRASMELVPPDVTTATAGLLDGVIREASPRAGYLHVVREQRNRMARDGMVALGGTFLWLLTWLAGLVMLAAGLPLVFGRGPGPVGFGPIVTSRIDRLVWQGGVGIGLLMILLLALVQAATPSGAWNTAFRWITERTVVVLAVGVLLSLALAYVAERRGFIALPLRASMMTLTVALAVAIMGLSAALIPEVSVVGKALESWYDPPASVSLPIELEQAPLPK